MCLLSEKGLGLCVTEDSWPRITEEAWQAGLPARWGRPRVCCELRICCSLGSLSGWEPGPTGPLGWGQEKRCWPVLAWNKVFGGLCVRVCLCRSKPARTLRGEGPGCWKPRREEAQAECPSSWAHPSGEHLRFGKGSLCFFQDSRHREPSLDGLTLLGFLCGVSFPFLRRLFLKILVGLC